MALPHSIPAPLSNSSTPLLTIQQLVDLDAGGCARMLDLTMDQLRTLAIVYGTKNALNAARLLRRQQSSIQSQLTTLNKHFSEICGEKLCSSTGRGEDYSFTQTGQFVAQLVIEILSNLENKLGRQRQNYSRELVVATTTFTQPFVVRTWNMVPELPMRVPLKLHQIRTREVGMKLRSEEYDLVMASHVTENGKTDFSDDWIFIPLLVERLTVITFGENNDLVSKFQDGLHFADQEKLFSTEKLVVPREGIIIEILNRACPDWQRKANIHDRIDDVRYGLNLLRSGMARGSMFVFEKVGEAALRGDLVTVYDQLEGGQEVGLRQLFLGDGFERFRIATGLFVRKNRLAQCPDDHPLQLFYQSFLRLVKKEK